MPQGRPVLSSTGRMASYEICIRIPNLINPLNVCSPVRSSRLLITMSRAGLCSSLLPPPSGPGLQPVAPHFPSHDLREHVKAPVKPNKTLSRPGLDYTQHLSSRSYTIRALDFGPRHFVGAALLDQEVARRLPPSFTAPQTPLHPPHKAYGISLTEREEKGFGLFALREFDIGDVIMVEHPIIVIPYILALQYLDDEEEARSSIYQLLHSDAQRQLLDLASSTCLRHVQPVGESRGSCNCGLLQSIINTNAIGIELSTPGNTSQGSSAGLSTHRAVFLHGSRLNHSCSPNALWTWSKDSFSFSLTAVRPIQEGEEITISYMPSVSTHTYRDRQAYLRNNFGFTCRCSHCRRSSRSHNRRRRSDDARVWLRRFLRVDGADQSRSRHRRPKFEEWCFDQLRLKDDYSLIRDHRIAIWLIEQEGLQVLGVIPHMEALVKCYGALADVDEFRHWVRKLWKEKKRFRGLNEQENRQLKEMPWQDEDLAFSLWLSNPLEFPAWGWRLKRTRRLSMGSSSLKQDLFMEKGGVELRSTRSL